MPDAFDPYWKWLGIRTSDTAPAPDHYRLLGIEPFEDDADVICAAADRQMTHVRSYQTGPHALACQRMLNELSAAKLCLLNSAKKAAYDEKLRGFAVRPSSARPGVSVQESLVETPPPIRVSTDNGTVTQRGSRSPQRPVLPKILAATSVLTALGLFIYVRLQDKGAHLTNESSPQSGQLAEAVDSARTSARNGQHTKSDGDRGRVGPSSAAAEGASGASTPDVGNGATVTGDAVARDTGNFVWPDVPEPTSRPLLMEGPFAQVWGELARRNPTLAMIHVRRLRGTQGERFTAADVELVEAVVQGIMTFWSTVEYNQPQIRVGDRLPWGAGSVVVAAVERSVPGQATIQLVDSIGTARTFALSRGAMPVDLAAGVFMYPNSTASGQGALHLGLFYGLDREARVERARELIDMSAALGVAGSITVARLEALGRSTIAGHESVPLGVVTNPPPESSDASVPPPSPPEIPETPAESSTFQPPTDQEYEAMMELVRKALGSQMQERNPTKRRAIAGELMRRAREPAVEPLAQFVLWNEVRKIGLEAGDIYLSLPASRQVAALYGERARPGKMAELLNELASHRGLKSGLENVLDSAITTAQEAIVVEDFASAATMYDLAMKLARRLNFRDAMAPLRQREAWVSAAAAAAERYRAGVKKLSTEPLDAAARETVGRYLCFVRQDYPAGLAHLALADHDTFRNLAAAERSTSAARQPTELVEMWLSAMGEIASYEQPALLLRTRYWSERAVEETSGLEKAAAEQRFREIVQQYESLVPEIVIARDLIPLVQPQRDSVDGHWRLHEQGLHSASSNYARLALPIQVRGSFQLRLVFTRLRGEPGNFVTFPVGSTNASIVMNGKTDKRFVLGLVMVNNRWISDRADGVTAPLALGVRYVAEIRVLMNQRGPGRVAIEAKVYPDDASLRIAPHSYTWEGPIADLRVSELFTAQPRQGNIVIGGNQVETIFHECRLLVAPDGEAQLMVP